MEELIASLPEPMQLNETTAYIIVIFLVLLVVLNLLIFKPLTKVLEERQRRISEGEEAQAQSLKTVEEKLAAYDEALIEARRKAQARRQQILKETEMVRNEIIASAKEQALAQVQAKATDLATQVEQAKGSLKRESEGIANRIVASVLSRATS